VDAQIVGLLILLAIGLTAGAVRVRMVDRWHSDTSQDVFDARPPHGGGLLLCDRCGAENTHSGSCVGCGARV